MRQFALLAVVCLLGCAGGHKIQYPTGWPIPTLTVPEGAKQCKLPMPMLGVRGGTDFTHSGVITNAGAPSEHLGWALAYESDKPWAELTRHTESQLKPLGYRLALPRHKPQVPPGISEEEATRDRRYISQDRKITVRLMFDPWERTYMLQISTYKKPVSNIIMNHLVELP